MEDGLKLVEDSSEYHYETELWWEDGDSETLVSIFTGESKNLTHEEKLANLVAGAQRELLRQQGQRDPQVRAEVRSYQTITYRKNIQTHWSSEDAGHNDQSN